MFSGYATVYGSIRPPELPSSDRILEFCLNSYFSYCTLQGVINNGLIRLRGSAQAGLRFWYHMQQNRLTLDEVKLMCTSSKTHSEIY